MKTNEPMNVNPEPLLSLPGLSRRVGCDPFTLRTRMARGELRPDFLLAETAAKPAAPLFRESRVPEVLRALGGAAGAASVRAAA